MKYKYHSNAKGMVLVIVLLLVTAITIVALGFIVRGDTELLFGQNMKMKAEMDYLAESGIAHGRGLVMCPRDLSGEPGEPNVLYLSQQQLSTGSDYYDVNVTKISNLDFQIKSDAYRMQGGSKFATNSLTAKLRLDPAVAFWSGADCRLDSSVTVNGDVYCNGALINQGTLNGDCFADSLTGIATGKWNAKTALTLSRPTIPYIRLTTNFTAQSIGGSSLNNTTLSGSPVVFYRNGDLEIKSSVNITGCLAVNGNLTITGSSNVITAKKNAPAIYVSGNLILKENAAITINGLIFVDGRIELPVINQSMNITGSLFTDDGIRYILPDYSGSGYDGIVNGDCAGVVGKLDRAINFDGNGDFINIGDPLGLKITSKITVAAWIKVNAFNRAYQAVITKGDSSWRLQRYANTNYMEFSCTGTSNPILFGSKNVNDGLWHHVAGVYDGSRIYLYVDGVLDKDQAAIGSISTNSASVYIGENSEQSGRYFDGIIDSVKVYKKGLSSVEILSLYTGGSPAGADLVGFWMMNTGSCATTIDSAPMKAAVWHWPSLVKDRWSPAAGAFYKSIARNP